MPTSNRKVKTKTKHIRKTNKQTQKIEYKIHAHTHLCILKQIIEKVKATKTKIAICYFREHQFRYTKRSKAFGYRQHTHEYGIFS